MSTTPKPKPPSKGPSPKLKQMLLDATPKEREQAIKIAARLLHRKATRG